MISPSSPIPGARLPYLLSFSDVLRPHYVRLRDDYIVTQCGLESVRNRFKMDVVYSWQGTKNVLEQVSQVR